MHVVARKWPGPGVQRAVCFCHLVGRLAALSPAFAPSAEGLTVEQEGVLWSSLLGKKLLKAGRAAV